MGSINETDELQELVQRKRRQRRIHLGPIEGDSRERLDRGLTPVDNTPILGATEILGDTFQSHVVFATGSLGKTSQKSNCKTNVKATDNVSIDEFAKYLTITKTNFLFQSIMFARTLQRTINFHKSSRRISRQRNRVKSITFASIGLFPSMCLKQAIDVCLAGQLDVVTSLMNVNTIVTNANALSVLDTNAKAARSGMGVNHGDELLGSSGRLGSNGKVIDLTTDQHELTINFTTIQIALVSRRRKTKLVTLENANNHTFPESTSLRVTLKSLLDGNDMGPGININAKTLTIPRLVGIINLQVALLRRRR